MRGTFSRWTSAPIFSPISPTAELNPPAPQSLMALYSSASRACTRVSSIFFSVMALPICTAPLNSVSWAWVISPLEKVAPWMPSRPVRPPTTTIASPGFGHCLALLARGITPSVPQKTSGLPRYFSSK